MGGPDTQRELTTRRLALGLGALVVVGRILVSLRAGHTLRYQLLVLSTLLAGLAVTAIRPVWSRWAVRVGGVFVVVLIAVATASGPPRLATAQALAGYGVLPLFALLLDGPVTVVLVATSSLAALVWLGGHVTFAGAHAAIVLSNVGLGLLIVSVAIAAEGRAGLLLREEATALAAARDRALADIEALNRLLFSDFRSVLQDLTPLLLQPDPARALPAVRSAAAQMRALLDRGRESVLRDEGSAPLAQAPPLTEAVLRSRGAPLLLATLLIGYGVALVRNLVGHNPIFANLASLALYSLLLLQGRRPRGVAQATAIALALAVTVFIGLLEWGSPPDAPPLAVLPGLAYALYWLLGIEAVGLWFVATAALLFLGYLPRVPDAAESVANVLAFSLAGLAACGLYWRNLRDALAEQTARAAAAADAARERRRLTTTFFHDQANLVMALEGAADPAEEAPPSTEQLGELNALALRMRDHLAAMGDLAGSSAVPSGELRPVAVRELFDGLALLFRGPVARKQQRLVFEGDQGLRLRAVPAVLLDSVLSNLVSNAIKFTPAGGSIRVGAEEREGEVLLRVLDEGAGMPPAVLEGLTREERLPSKTGSAGERGNGFGLVLAQQTTRRMGGLLEVGAPARGAEVRLRFPAAGQG